MGNDTAVLTLAVLGALLTWTATVVGIMLWLNAKFNAGERLVYKEVKRTRATLARILNQHGGRIMRLELMVFKSTLSGDEPNNNDESQLIELISDDPGDETEF